MPTVVPKLTKGLMYQGSWGPLQCNRDSAREFCKQRLLTEKAIYLFSDCTWGGT